MDSTATALLLGCILLLSVEITPFIAAQPVPTVGAAGATPGGAAGAAAGGAATGAGAAAGGAATGAGAAGAATGAGAAGTAAGGAATGAGAAGAEAAGADATGAASAATGPGAATGAGAAGAASAAAGAGAATGAGAPGAATGAGAGGATGSGAAGAATGAGAAGAPSAATGAGAAAAAPGAGAAAAAPGAGTAAAAGAGAGAASSTAGAPGAAPGVGAAAAAPGGAVGPAPSALAAADAPGTTSAGNASADGYKITTVTGPPIVPCYFIFGDSLADSGNNNNLASLARANFLPYGVDYPAGPTGRFTNGRTYVDFIAEFLGFDHHIPPHAAVQGSEKVLQGVNYASGSAGIRPETGKIVGDRISLDQQLDNHRATIARIKELKGNDDAATTDHLGKCLYTVGIGSNDYMNNYLVAPANPKNVVFTPDSWAQELARRIHDFLKNLHDLGARKVALYGLGPIGCEPSQVKPLRLAGKPGCVDSVNHIISLYNQRLPAIIDEHNKVLPGAKFIFINNSHISPGDNPARIGVKVGDKPCCPTEAVAGSCVRNSVPCPERGDYSFFDQYHPTEKAVLPGAKRAWQALEPQDTYPMDISRLARLP